MARENSGLHQPIWHVPIQARREHFKQYSAIFIPQHVINVQVLIKGLI